MMKSNSTPCPSNGKKLRYVQPPVREIMRPAAAYQPPTIPIDCETVQKTSYTHIDEKIARQCRLPPAIPELNLNTNPDVKIDSQTVTSISFGPIVDQQKSQTIIPADRIALGTGPTEKMTTQKHDYVLKKCKPPGPIKPLDCMTPSTHPIESETTTGLSFSSPTGFIPVQSCKPDSAYKQPEIRMDLETCHKQSFQSPHTKPREIPPWAVKPRFVKPMIPIDAKTVQNCSYRPPGVCVEIDDDDVNDNKLASVEYYVRAGL